MTRRFYFVDRLPGNVAAVAAMLLLAAPAPGAGQTLEDVLKAPHFSEADIAAVRQGRFGVARIHELSDRELAVAVACLVQGEPKELLAPFLADALPVEPEHLKSQALIDPASPVASFARISLNANADEVRQYLDARPGFGLNLSHEEIAAFSALREAQDPAAVEALLQETLYARYLAYQQDGLDGARPYARESGDLVIPGQELRRSEEAMTGLHALYPDFHGAWLRYPGRLPDGMVGEDHFWIKLEIDDRPVFLLSHRLVAAEEDAYLVGIRDYYASHFLDVSQRVATVTPLDTGEQVLIYIERAWVDYWSGLVSLKRKIGHKILTKRMEHLLEEHRICGP